MCIILSVLCMLMERLIDAYVSEACFYYLGHSLEHCEEWHFVTPGVDVVNVQLYNLSHFRCVID